MNGRIYALFFILMVAQLTIPGGAQAQTWKELNAKSEEFGREGRYLEGISVAEEALRVAEKKFGLDHTNVAISLHNLSLLHASQGEYNDAALLVERSNIR